MSEFEELEFPGVTDPKQIEKMRAYYKRNAKVVNLEKIIEVNAARFEYKRLPNFAELMFDVVTFKSRYGDIPVYVFWEGRRVYHDVR